MQQSYNKCHWPWPPSMARVAVFASFNLKCIEAGSCNFTNERSCERPDSRCGLDCIACSFIGFADLVIFPLRRCTGAIHSRGLPWCWPLNQVLCSWCHYFSKIKLSSLFDPKGLGIARNADEPGICTVGIPVDTATCLKLEMPLNCIEWAAHLAFFVHWLAHISDEGVMTGNDRQWQNPLQFPIGHARNTHTHTTYEWQMCPPHVPTHRNLQAVEHCVLRRAWTCHWQRTKIDNDWWW